MNLRHAIFDSPLGAISVVAGDGGLEHIHFDAGDSPFAPPPGARAGRNAHLDAAERELAEYFAGTRRKFDVPLAAAGTAFQRRVWRALLDIPYGSTDSYGAIAQRIGRPRASRAVGAANGRNPLPIIVPCHRVIAASGSLGGYTGGVWLKRALLDLERGQSGCALADRRRGVA